MTGTLLQRPQEKRSDESSSASTFVPRTVTRSWLLSIGTFAVVSAICAWMGFYASFNSFAPQDDEGDLLSTLQTFAHHGALYTHVYSAFGPFYFEAFSTIFSWVPLSLDVGRATTLVVTIVTSLGFGVAIRMLTRSLLAGVATQLGLFMLLILLFVNESMHPTLAVSFLSAVAFIALALIAVGHRSTGFMLLGAAVAALALTIANVGFLATTAILYMGLVLFPPFRAMRFLRAAAAALFIGAPFLLVFAAKGHAVWEIKLAAVVAIAAASVVVVTFDRNLQGLVQPRDACRFLVGGGAMGLIVVVIAIVWERARWILSEACS